MPTLQMRKRRLREWQSLSQATELELGSSKEKLMPLKGLATSPWQWLSQELMSVLWVLTDVVWFGTNPMSTSGNGTESTKWNTVQLQRE